MKNRIKFFMPIIIVLLVVFVGSLFLNNNRQSITTILSKPAYAKLPKEAKEYIKEVYEKTGEVILTEDNKEENKPYLNPDYIKYLEVGKASEYGHIPEKYIIDHSYKNDVLTKQGTPNEKVSRSYYNLRDEGFITNVYDQGSEGLCWAFSTVTSLESHLAIKSNKTKMLTFSEKQLDYATTKAEKALDIGSNPFLNNNSIIGEDLNDGGNMLRFANGTAIGISPILCDGNCSNGTNYNNNNSITSNKYWKYDYNYNAKLSPLEITNFDNVEYSLNEFLFFNPLSTNKQSDVDALVNLIKEQIVTNGSLYVGVGAYTNLSIEYTPAGAEQALNSNGKNLIYYIPYGWNPASGINHAVSVIGWDDNYTHNICLDKPGFVITDAKKIGNDYSCTKGDLHTINGAWIVQNSWGNNKTFIYLPYNTMKSSYSSISNVSEVDYDNSYRAMRKYNTFTKGNTKERVSKVKFFVNAYNKKISVLYSKATNEIIVQDSSVYGPNLLKSQTYSQPGLYTIDISENNIVFDENTSQFKLSFNGDSIKYDEYASIHTNNVDDDKFIDLLNINKTDHNILTKCTLEDNKCIAEKNTVSFNDNNVFILSGISRDLKSNDDLTIKILNENQIDVTNQFHIFRNFAVSNYINAFISYNSENVSLGTYMIEVYYNNKKYDELEWKLTKHNNNLQGIGTKENPYLINTVADLDDIRNHKVNGFVEGYYVLNNDLDLTYDTQNKNGLFYNSGKGWNPISDFAGSFDGNNHVIKGLFINRSETSNVGLFSEIYGTNNYIKNIIIKDVSILGQYDSGALAGEVYVTDGIEISNISMVGGTINSSYSSGGLIGYISSTKGVTANINCYMDNLYSNVIVGDTNTVFAGGIIGGFGSTNQILSITIKDAISYSKVSGKGNFGSSSIGGIIGSAGYLNNLTINNIISVGSYVTNSSARTADIAGAITKINTLNINNTYYVDKVYGFMENISTQTIRNNYPITREGLLNNNYTNSFTTPNYWVKPTINGIKRFPLPKNLEGIFDYTEIINNYSMKITDTKNIYDLITPTNDIVKNINWNYNDEYLTINNNGIITPKKVGTTTIHIDSLYDGYSSDIELTITDVRTITFNSNNPDSQVIKQYVNIGESFSLSKNNFAYKGRIFNGWNTQSDGNGIAYIDEQLISNGISEDLTLYAQWEDIEYTITFDANNGENFQIDWKIKYPSDGKIVLGKKEFSKDNHILESWNTKKDGTGQKYLTDENNYSIDFDKIPFDENNNITLYAQWEKLEYEITFDSNGGSGTMSPQYYAFDETKNITLNSFTRPNYTFKNWNTKKDGTGISYTNGQSISLTENITLYAQWEESFSYMINKYNVDETKRYISKVPVGTTVDDYKQNIVLGTNYTVEVSSKVVDNKNVIYTGSETKFYNNQNIGALYINIVLGDINGDGVINSADLLKIRQHLLGINALGAYYFEAAEITGEGTINSADLLRIRQHLLGTKLIG